MNPEDILKKYWGFDAFRPLQKEIINSVLQGYDTLALLPTGGGKSICYQVPALMMDGICLVVSPLISLMKDQVQQLRDRGIKASCLVSGLTANEQEVILNNCLHGKTKLLYVSPERLMQRVFIEHFRQMKITLIAVDEAHCISQWGYDFRPPYLEIARIRDYHSQVPIIALTATATPVVMDDIRRLLLFRKGHHTLQASFFRSNLAYMVFHEEDKEGRLLRIARHTGGSGIVYVRNRRRTRLVADYLVNNGIPATYYHAGMTPKERDTAQLRWMKGDVQIMVATNAFGMGIDKPDVRFVVHLDIPTSIEAYFQEAGRAGRDGNKAYAVLLYDDVDKTNLHDNFNINYPTSKQIGNVYKAICNYYQLPVGAGTDCQFDFDMEAICSNYHFNVVEMFNAAKVLEREGLIAIPERNETESRVYIPLSQEELYRFQVSQARYSDLLTLLLRMYGGLFTDFVPISERALARRLNLDEQQITNMLHHMDALKAIQYKAKTTKPQIIFTSPRIDSTSMVLSDNQYAILKQQALQRVEAILHYVTATSGCRSAMLLNYFGEEESKPCGVCDLCLTANHKLKKENHTSLRQQIIALLKEQPLRADELSERLHHIDENEMQTVLRTLVDERTVSINQSLQFFI